MTLEKIANMNISQNVPSSLTSWTQISWWQWTTHNTIMFLCCWNQNIWCWWIQHYKQDQSTCSRLSAGDFLTFSSPVQLSLAKNNTGMVSIENHWKITFFLKKRKNKVGKMKSHGSNVLFSSSTCSQQIPTKHFCP